MHASAAAEARHAAEREELRSRLAEASESGAQVASLKATLAERDVALLRLQVWRKCVWGRGEGPNIHA